MTIQQIVSPTRSAQLTKTHPYTATITLDPSEWARFHQLAENHSEAVITSLDRSTRDMWTVTVACASETVREKLEDAGW